MITETLDHLQRSSRRFAARDSLALWLKRRRFPRVAVFAAIAVCAAIGLACSIGLRRAGLTAMSLRYPLAAGVSGVALGTILGWFAQRASRLVEGCDEIRREALRLQFRRNDAELPDAERFLEHLSDASDQASHQRYDPRALPAYLVTFLSLTVILVCVYFVWMAPVLLADVVIEGSLAAWLFRPMFGPREPQVWTTAIEKTAIPAIVLTLACAGIGVVFDRYAPNATTAAKVWQHVQQQRNAVAARR